MKTSRNIGVWIDTQEATIIELLGSKVATKKLRSGITSKPRVEGEVSRKTTRASTGFDYQSSQKAHFENALSQFMKVVAHEIVQADSLFIFGPAEAKLQLDKEVRKSISGIRVAAVEPCDRLSDAKKVEKVRAFFAAKPR
jgi:hypothetical protein